MDKQNKAIHGQDRVKEKNVAKKAAPQETNRAGVGKQVEKKDELSGNSKK